MQLFNLSGEGPRGLDADLEKSVKTALTHYENDDRAVIEWLLNPPARQY
jgi:hypothetical protein